MGWDWDICCGDGVGTGIVVIGTGWGWGQWLWGWGGDGFCVHGDGWGWGSVSVPMQTSRLFSQCWLHAAPLCIVSFLHASVYRCHPRNELLNYTLH